MAAMTFETKRLVELAKQAVANKDAAVAEWEQIKADYIKQHRSEWWNNERKAQLRAVRNYFTNCLNRDKPPLDEEYVALVDGGSIRGLTYSPPSDWQISRMLEREQPPHLKIDTTDYRALIEVLESSDAERVSPNQLAVLGFKSSALQRLFRESLKAES